MPEFRDPAIKLFGKTIALPANDGGGGDGEEDKVGLPNKENTIASKNRELESPSSEEKGEPVASIADDNHKKSSSDEQEAEPEKNSNRAEEEQNDSNNQQEKTLKKPDKILPCPRCNSLDTKFCYYNNYNVNQPRHFCKNCQRYWTAGGTMRNVPVGAGRRKNKSSLASHYRHLAVSDVGLLAIPDQIHHPSLKPNGTVLSFGSEAPHCDSMASVLSLAEKAAKSCHHRNGFHRGGAEEPMEEQSSVSSVTPSNCNDEGAGGGVGEPVVQSCQGFAPPVPYPNGSPWPFPWNPPPAICAPTYPMPFYPASAYWGCTPWSFPWLQPLTSPSPTSVSSGSGPSSPALGKHSREEVVLPRDSGSEKGDSTVKQSNQEGCRLWIPKTLRIHDPEEAAKSSVWATMGFRNDKTDGGQGFFKGFQKQGEPSRTYLDEASQALHANPAALSRSVSFQESS
ncbi:hypothetical protein M6B38_347280 [Iris pallida]|uniref:Dof-type domain-containing protein n=1 Tax=Iris pallida TaxID=29817 RepID=A0AAX6GSM1_IRIPA|nr:hypothetical protein M6B38_347280 [Iris pallida]